jgi:hypothetical protein
VKAEEKSEREKQAVPADGNWAKGKNRRGDVPNDVMHAVFTLTSFGEGSIPTLQLLFLR